MMRFDGRKNDDLRDFSFELDYTIHSAGSVLACFGNTKVLCNATIEPRVPRWMAGKGEGWVTAEYGMLPASTNTRNIRESTKGKQSGRTLEIQRLIGRSLRGAVMNNDGEFIEIQGTAESGTFTAEQLNSMIKLAEKGVREIIERQQKIFGEN